MAALFYIAALVGVVSTGMVITTQRRACVAVLDRVVACRRADLLSTRRAVRRGAGGHYLCRRHMVLFLFVVMMLNQGPPAMAQERRWLQPGMWTGPSVLAMILLGELAYLFGSGTVNQVNGISSVNPKEVSIVLLGPYLIGVELASMLLLPGLIGAYHLGRRVTKAEVQT